MDRQCARALALLVVALACVARGENTVQFTDVTARAGISFRHVNGATGKRYFIETMGPGCAFLDYNSDGYLDIYMVNGHDLAGTSLAKATNVLYRNNGDGTFTDVGLLTGVAYSEDGKMESSMGADFGDYDRDGYIDLIVPNFQGEATRLYRNTGDGFFSDESATSGIGAATRAYVGWGVGFLDYDNDGGLDLFIAAGHVLDNVKLFDTSTSYPQRNFLFRNSGPGKMDTYTFTDVSAVAGGGLAVAKSSRGTAFGDYDNDGDVDILVVNCNDSATLLRNDGGNRGHWLRIKTEGVRSNRDGIGARIEAISGNLIQLREVRSGSSLYCQNDLRASFGLGDRSKVDRIEIRWPSGITDTLVNLSADQSIAVREGFGLIEAGR